MKSKGRLNVKYMPCSESRPLCCPLCLLTIRGGNGMSGDDFFRSLSNVGSRAKREQTRSLMLAVFQVGPNKSFGSSYITAVCSS